MLANSEVLLSDEYLFLSTKISSDAIGISQYYLDAAGTVTFILGVKLTKFNFMDILKLRGMKIVD